jgi:hypothetical protein
MWTTVPHGILSFAIVFVLNMSIGGSFVSLVQHAKSVMGFLMARCFDSDCYIVYALISVQWNIESERNFGHVASLTKLKKHVFFLALIKN